MWRRWRPGRVILGLGEVILFQWRRHCVIPFLAGAEAMIKSVNGTDTITPRENTPLIAARRETPKTDTANALRHEGSSVVYFACRAPRTPGNSRRPIPNRSSNVR